MQIICNFTTIMTIIFFLLNDINDMMSNALKISFTIIVFTIIFVYYSNLVLSSPGTPVCPCTLNMSVGRGLMNGVTLWRLYCALLVGYVGVFKWSHITFHSHSRYAVCSPVIL